VAGHAQMYKTRIRQVDLGPGVRDKREKLGVWLAVYVTCCIDERVRCAHRQGEGRNDGMAEEQLRRSSCTECTQIPTNSRQVV
jgi:hypothetical protein